MNPTRTIVLPWLVSAGVIVAIVTGLTVLMPEPPSPIQGTIAVGTANDGSLLVRSQMCDGEPTDVSVRVGTPNAGTGEIARFPAATEIRADLTGADPNTTLTISSDNTEGVRVSLVDWMRVTPGTWLVTDAAADGLHTTALATAELPDRAC